MAGTSKYLSESSSFRNSFEHNAFLSFRGEDVRRTFVDHLYEALNGSGFKVFRDNDGLEHGQDIQSKLYQAIERSQLSIVTFSCRYADSRWCLDELVKIMDCRATHGHTVLPVFYNVEPTHVRHQSGPYKEAFSAHKQRFEMSRVNKWRLALEQVADLKGLSSHDFNGYEGQLVQNIIHEVRKIVDPRLLNLPPYIAGTDSMLEEISSWLQDESLSVSFGVIYGLSGIGKTTIAKIAYNKNLDKFDGCSFLADFKGLSPQGNGFAHLLEQLISDVSGKKPNKIYNFDKGIIKVRAIISCKRILLVLDNVDTWIQIHPLLQNPGLFHPGSKIIITTTNADIGNAASVECFCVHPLKHDESRSLFCQLAFGKDFPSRNFTIISERFIEYCGGHPLALEILALSLRGSKIEIWEVQVAKLESSPNKELLDIFKLSFDSLEHDNDKDIFLHVAFFLVGMEKDLAIRILESCGLCPKIGLQNLSNRLLVTEDCDGRLMMHQLILNMGREIVRQEAQTEPGQRSRLWSFKDTYRVLQNNEGTKTIKGLHLDVPVTHSDSSLEDEYTRENSKRRGWMAYLHPTPSSPITANSRSLRTDAFTKMKNLNLLQLNNVQLEGGFRKFPKVIKLLWWNGCPLESLPMEFDLYELVVLEICNSRLVHAWGAGKVFGALSVLNLSHSHLLVETPDFSLALKLEMIKLEDCSLCFSQMSSIQALIVGNCISLERITHSVGTSIPNYVMSHNCPKLVEIKGVFKIEATKDLDADRTRYMGYPGLESFGDSKGVYPSEYGIYSLHVPGNHIAKWFTIVTSGSDELFYTVPLLPDREIRAFNVCFVSKFHSENIFEPRRIWIQNMRCNWVFGFDAAYCFAFVDGIEDGCEMTWLTHWPVVKPSELRPGDILRISSIYPNVSEFGIKIIYEDLEEDFGRDYAMESIESCSSGRRRGMDIDYVTEHENEERRVENNRVADWYKNTFRGVDLSQRCIPYDYKNDPSIKYGIGCFFAGGANFYFPRAHRHKSAVEILG